MKLSTFLFAVALGSLSSFVLGVPSQAEEEEVDWPEIDQRELQKHATPAPTPAPGTDTNVNVRCFTGDSRVQVAGKGLVELKELQVGDQILTGKERYQPVYAFGHFEPDEVGEFLYIETQIPLEPLKLTQDHLVFVDGKDHPVRAASLKVGDVLVRAQNQQVAPSRITSIRGFMSKGLYTPLTEDATLVVDGVVASSYISLQSDQDEYVEFPIGGTSWKWSHQDYVHWTLAPFRVFCGISSELCQLRTAQGIPYYIEGGIGAVQWAHRQGGIVEIVFLFFALALFAACRLVEVTVGVHALVPLAFVGGASYVYMKNHCAKVHPKKTV